MNKREMDAVRLVNQLQRLPENVQEQIEYMIQGALLISKVQGQSEKQTATR